MRLSEVFGGGGWDARRRNVGMRCWDVEVMTFEQELEVSATWARVNARRGGGEQVAHKGDSEGGMDTSRDDCQPREGIKYDSTSSLVAEFH